MQEIKNQHNFVLQKYVSLKTHVNIFQPPQICLTTPCGGPNLSIRPPLQTCLFGQHDCDRECGSLINCNSSKMWCKDADLCNSEQCYGAPTLFFPVKYLHMQDRFVFQAQRIINHKPQIITIWKSKIQQRWLWLNMLRYSTVKLTVSPSIHSDECSLSLCQNNKAHRDKRLWWWVIVFVLEYVNLCVYRVFLSTWDIWLTFPFIIPSHKGT